MKIKVFYLYLLGILWVTVLASFLRIGHFNATGLGMTLTFLTLIFIPGIFLWRISRIEETNYASKWLFIIASGFGFYFLINFLAIIFSLTLTRVLWLDFILGIILFLVSLWRDRRSILELNFRSKKYNLSEWILIIFIILLLVIGFLAVNAQVDKIIGDGMFHLAILQKVVSAENLNPYNLWVTKTAALNLVYSFPIWHIFLGEIAKILSINIFTAYTQVLLPLVVLTFIGIFAFIKIIFRERLLVMVIYLTFLVFLFSGIFYTLIPLRSPDSFNRLLILPLVLGLTVEYLFGKNKKILPQVLLVAFSAIFMGLIHFTQLIDYFLVLFVFLVLFLMIDRDKEVLKKFGWLCLVIGGLTSPYLLIFQRVNIYQLLTNSAAAYTGDNFPNESYHNASIITLYTVISLPILSLFLKNKRQLIFFVSIPIALLLVSWRIFGLRELFLKYSGEIFTVRAVTDIPGFVFLGFIFFILILILSLILAKLSKIIQGLLYVFLGVLTLTLLVFFKNDINFLVDTTIFNAKNLFFYNFFEPIVIIIVALALIFYIIVRFHQKKELIISEPKNKFSFAFLGILFFLILSWPYWPVFAKTMANNFNGSLIANRELPYFGDIGIIGGNKTITFLNNLPSKSVIAFSNVNTTQISLLYTKAYVFEYPYAVTDFTLTKTIYDPKITIEARLKFIESNQIDYVVALQQEENNLFQNASSFQKVFENHYKYEVKTKKTSYQKDGEFIVYKYLH